MTNAVVEIFEQLFMRYPNIVSLKMDIWNAFELMQQCYTAQGKILVCGNGGSAADAEHITAELMKGFLLKRALDKKDLEKFNIEDHEFAKKLQYGLPAISLVSQTALLTALDNDNGAEMTFAQQVFAYGKEADILIGISTSGNSTNVINATKVAKAKGLKTIILSGGNGGALCLYADVAICVNEDCVYKIQEYHLPIYHCLCEMIEEYFFGKLGSFK